MHGLAPAVADISAQIRTSRQWLAVRGGSRCGKCAHFTGLSRGGGTGPGAHGTCRSKGDTNRGMRAVLTYRLATGFGGLILVAMILFLVQMLTGIRTFPL
jgi:hypothetical protein